MKKLILALILGCFGIVQAQTFPVNNLTVVGSATFANRPVFNGQTPYDTGNLNISLYAPLASPVFTGNPVVPGYLTISNAASTYAPIASPTFTGTPAAPTAAPGTNTTQLATTSFVANSFAPLASPALTGVPTAPTAVVGSNSTQLSTTAFDAAGKSCLSIMDHGGDNTGVSDNVSAYANTIAASPTGRVCVYFPAGTYLFSSGQAAYSMPNTASQISILGAGAGISTLQFTGGTQGIYIIMPGGQANAAHIRDISLTTSSASSPNPAIQLINNTNGGAIVPQEVSDITNVSIHGDNGYPGTHYWSTGIQINSWSNINFIGVNIYGGSGGGPFAGYTGQGTGINFSANTGSGTPPLGVQYNVIGCNIDYLLTGIQYNANVQGVSVASSNFVGGTFGISIPTSQNGTSQLSVVNSQFNEGTYGIQDGSGVPAAQVIGNYFLIPTPASSSAGINFTNAYGAEIIGNQFQRVGVSATGTNGIVMGSTTGPGSVILGNIFINLTTAVWLNSSSSNDNVQANRYAGNGTNVLNQGAGNSVGVATP